MSKKTEERYKALPAGVRNNNYLNIKKSGSKWKGTRLPKRNHPFVEFISPEWGYRAAFIIMAKTYRKRGIKSVAQIIQNWAPTTENNTSMYIATVKARLIKWNDCFKCRDYEMPDPVGDDAKGMWVQLAHAMTFVEIGREYAQTTKCVEAIGQGYDLAFK